MRKGTFLAALSLLLVALCGADFTSRSKGGSTYDAYPDGGTAHTFMSRGSAVGPWFDTNGRVRASSFAMADGGALATGGGLPPPYACTAGTFGTGEVGDGGWNCATPTPTQVSAFPHPVTSGRKLLWASPLLSNANAVTVFGLGAPATVGVAAVATPLADGMFIKHASTTTINTVGGIYSNTWVVSRPYWLPHFQIEYRTQTDTIASRRSWVGFSSTTLDTTTPTLGTALSAIRIAALAYDSSVSAYWLCCTSTGANSGGDLGCEATGTAVAVDTAYLMEIKFTTSSAIVCRVNGAETARSTTMPATDGDLGYYVATKTLVGGAAAAQYVGTYSIEQN